MTWRGVLRVMAAEARRYERAEHRRQRELARLMATQAKWQEKARAANEVEAHENLISCLTTVHREVGADWDWLAIYKRTQPVSPIETNVKFREARQALADYQPSLVDRLFGRSERRREELKRQIEAAVEADARDYAQALEKHRGAVAEWQEGRDLAERVLNGAPPAMSEAFLEVQPLSELAELGSRITCQFLPDRRASIDFHVNGLQVVPDETKILLKTGKVSRKKMPLGQYFGIYQDFVCGGVLRIAREMFAFLPLDMVLVTVLAEVLNSSTGHVEELPILSIVIPRATLVGLNFSTLDASDALRNFVHNMDFKKTKGFGPVSRVTFPALTGA